jgi:hypothetical protein
VKDRSLKDEMRQAVRGDRERAAARKQAEEEGAYVGPAPPTIDLNRPTREWKLPEKPTAEDPEREPIEVEPEPVELEPEPEPEPEIAPRPEPEPGPDLEPAAVAHEPEPEAETSGFLARLGAFFRR